MLLCETCVRFDVFHTTYKILDLKANSSSKSAALQETITKCIPKCLYEVLSCNQHNFILSGEFGVVFLLILYKHHKMCGNGVCLLSFFLFRKTDETIECTMPPALQVYTDSVTVCVEFENLPCQSAELSATYTYEKNPTISFIHPKKSYLRWVDCHTHPTHIWNVSSWLTLFPLWVSDISHYCNVILMCSFFSLLCSK